MKSIGLFRVGNDPEIKYTAEGFAFMRLSLAYSYFDKERKTQWVDAAIVGKKAESIGKYIHKGDQICATLDNLRVEQYTTKDGEIKSKLSGIVSDIELVSAKKEDDSKGQRVTKSEPARQAPKQAPRPTGTGFDDLDDDIPF